MTDSPYARVSAELAALGYHAIPIMPLEKAPGEYRGGQWWRMSEWQRYRDRAPSRFEMDLWARLPEANAGLVLGSVARRGLHIIAIDADATDPDELDTILSALPYSPMAKVGGKGETRFYAASQDIRSKPYNHTASSRRLVDLLTGFDTRQTVIPPSVHVSAAGEPSGKVYRWLSGPVAAADLPEFTAEDLERLEDTLRHLGWDPEAVRVRKAPPVDVEEDEYFTETKARALASLDAWVPGLDLYGCRPARSGYEAVATWRPSSTGRPLVQRKRNLSIQPNGIQDFGTGQGYSAIDLVMHARTCDMGAAADWLRGQLGLRDDSALVTLRPKARAPAASAGGAVVALADHMPELELDAVPFDGEMPPPRPWAFGNILLDRTVTALAAPAGTGKSTWTLQLALAFCTHRALGPFEPKATGPAWVWNNEDDRAELNRRVFAAASAMSINPGDLAGRLYLNTGAERALIVAREDRRTKTLVATPDVQGVIAVIRRRGIKLLVVDPFAETFEVETENSNDLMKRVAGLYREIAWQSDCAVALVAHTPKGAGGMAGNLDAIRGGAAIGGVVRSALTLFEMTDADAETLGVDPDNRHLYVRLDVAKANMALKSNAPVWWRKETVLLGNETEDRPEDGVGVLVHHTFSSGRRSSSSRRNLPASAQKIMAAFGRLMAEGPNHDAPNVPGVKTGTRAVTLNDLRNKSFDLGLGGPQPDAEAAGLKEWDKWRNTRNVAFNRGMETLEEAGCLRTEQGFAWEIRGNLGAILED